MKAFRFFLLFLALSAVLGAQEAPTKPSVSVAKLGENLHEITAQYGAPIGTKLLALTGSDGILLVDSGYPQTAPLVLEELKKLSSGKIRYLVNTHLHGDHVGGNAVLAPGAIVIAQENVRRRLTSGLGLLAPLPESALPAITFGRALTLYVNGEEVRMAHAPNTHSDGDITVHFVRAGVVAVGDLLFPDKFPYMDLTAAGNVRRYLDNLKVLASAFPEGTRFVASHGPVYSSAQLKAYHDDLIAMLDLVRKGLKAGKSVEQLKGEKVLEPWVEWGTSYIPADRFIESLAGADRPAPSIPQASVLDRIVPSLQKGDGEAAVALYRRLRKEEPDAYLFDENEINQLGYALLQQGRTADAIAIFKLNVEEHPASWNPYDSLGEAYMNNGQKELAIRNYEKSLELNPANTNAVQALEKLKKP